VDEEQGKRGISRRDLIKTSVVAGGVVWVAPTLLARPAGAGVSCDCPAGHLFAIKTENAKTGTTCTFDFGPAQFDCIDVTGATSAQCLIDSGDLIPPNSCPDGQNTHVYQLGAGVQFCAGGAKGGCVENCGTTTVVGNTVTITHQCLSHSEILVCVPGTLPEECVDD
jgi:hypothetical protein